MEVKLESLDYNETDIGRELKMEVRESKLKTFSWNFTKNENKLIQTRT